MALLASNPFAHQLQLWLHLVSQPTQDLISYVRVQKKHKTFLFDSSNSKFNDISERKDLPHGSQHYFDPSP